MQYDVSPLNPIMLCSDRSFVCVWTLQDVVPQALLDQYLSMTDPSRAQTVDMEIAKHCAYSLPGVALTLGRQNWHCLRDTYETLASDMQVRHADTRVTLDRSDCPVGDVLLTCVSVEGETDAGVLHP